MYWSGVPINLLRGMDDSNGRENIKRLQDDGGEIGRFARKGVTYNSDLQSYIVRLRDTDGMCPMLNEDQLCEIVLNKGNKKLCRTCATFPRETVRSYDTDEKYIFLGCPKAAHLLFEVSGKITFMFERDPDLDMEDIPIYNHVMKINLTVRGEITDFIQKSELPLWFREFYGAYTIEK